MPPRIPIPVSAFEQILPWLSRGRISQAIKPFLIHNGRSALPSQRPDFTRNFTKTPLLFKKGGKKEAKSSSAEETTEVEDPHDFSTLEDGIEKSLTKLQEDLSKLRTGGRFNTELLESVRVHLAKDSKTAIRLGDLAQVLPKGGRSVVLLVGEADHVKPIISAIQGSPDLNLQPQQDPHNALQLNIPIPPPTKESRDLALSAAGKVGEIAGNRIRNTRGLMQKRLRAMELKRSARPDDLKKAHKDLEKVVEKGHADIKKIVETAKKAMENS